jgi:hypothetical protein
VRQFPHLQQQLKLLTDFLEDTAADVFPAGSEASRKETAFALRYMAKEADIIPDSAPEIGYAAAFRSNHASPQVCRDLIKYVFSHMLLDWIL